MDGFQPHSPALRIEVEDRLVGDDPAGSAEQSELPAILTAVDESGAGDEGYGFVELARFVAHGDDRAPGTGCNIVAAAAAGEPPELSLRVAQQSGVDVAICVHFQRAQKAYVHQAAVQHGPQH